MDELDTKLLDAWAKVREKVRRDPEQALWRSRRAVMKLMRRPMRAWCLVIRAADSRITEMNAIIDPRGADENLQAHTLTLDGALIRQLCRPVRIPWPGVTIDQAAPLLGRPRASIEKWLKQGVFQVNRYREYGFPGVGRQYLWTPSPLDPNNFQGGAPHQVWGTLWQHLWERLPLEYVLTVRREAQWQGDHGRSGFRGWVFICPWRLNEREEYRGCGRACRYLYGPQTVWTLPMAMGFNEPIDLPQPKGGAECGLAGQWLAGQWLPGLNDPITADGSKRSFACKECWGVRSAGWSNTKGWNDFVTWLSGGLLRGSDVPRPLDTCPNVRCKPEYRWKKRRKGEAEGAAGRDELERIVSGGAVPKWEGVSVRGSRARGRRA